MFAYNLCAGLLRAIGNSFMPLVFLILSSVLNVILDLWFIAVLGMGVAGAGVATVISQGVSVVLCIHDAVHCVIQLGQGFHGVKIDGKNHYSASLT